jgi:hypothetical protein
MVALPSGEAETQAGTGRTKSRRVAETYEVNPEIAENDSEKPVPDWLPLIDGLMTKMNVPLGQRPFQAAVFLVRECVVAIEGDTKDDFWRRPWFAAMYRVIDGWYEERYGDALDARSGKIECGLAVIYELPFKLLIPVTLIEPDQPGESFWLVYPSEVLPNEDILGWLVKPPNLARLSPDEVNDVRQQITKVAGSCD